MTEIALLKIDNIQSLPVAKLGSSSSLRTGEFAVALGSPMRLIKSASAGIISSPVRHANELGITHFRTYLIQV